MKILKLYIVPLLIIFITNSNVVHALNSEKIIPHLDLEYLGAFTTPKNGQFESSPGGGTFNPDGDPLNVDNDPYSGSLFIMASAKNRTVGEISIPMPQPKRLDNDWRLLPQASVIQTPTEITGGYTHVLSNEDPGNPPTETANTDWATSDVEIIGPEQGATSTYLLWVLGREYTQTQKLLTIGASNIDFSTSLSTYGYWRLDFPTTARYSDYLFKIPKDWADQYTGGKNIVIGQNRYSTNGSNGVTMYAIKPWITGKPEPDGTNLGYTTMLEYISPDATRYMMDYYMESNTPGDGTWVRINNKNSIVFYGTYGERDRTKNKRYDFIPQYVYAATPFPDEYGESKGFIGSPYQQALYFYDPNELLKGMNGSVPMNEIQPYAAFSIEKHVYSGLNQSKRVYGMITYNTKDNILFVEEILEGAVGTGRRSVIHMFRVKDVGKSENLDYIPPTNPKNLTFESISSKEILISWEPGKDSVTDTWHVVLRNDMAISFIKPGIKTFLDDKIDEWLTMGTNIFKYQIIALDEYYNYSERSNIINYNFEPKAYSDIVYYHNCDNFGKATLASGDSNVYPEADAYVYENHRPGYGLGQWQRNPFKPSATEIGVHIPLKDNISLDKGRLGFVFVPYGDETTYIKTGFLVSSDGTNPDQFSVELIDGNTIRVGYKREIKNIPVNFTETIEGPNKDLKWDVNVIEFKFENNSCTVYLNGIERGIITPATLDKQDASNLIFLKHRDGLAAIKATIDQIIFSNDVNRKIYSIRSETGFGKIHAASGLGAPSFKNITIK